MRMVTEWLPNGYRRLPTIIERLPTAVAGYITPAGVGCRVHLLRCEHGRRNSAPQLALCRRYGKSTRLLAGRDFGAAARKRQVLLESVPVAAVDRFRLREIGGEKINRLTTSPAFEGTRYVLGASIPIYSQF